MVDLEELYRLAQENNAMLKEILEYVRKKDDPDYMQNEWSREIAFNVIGNIITKYLTKSRWYVEPFAGGMNMMDKVNHPKRLASDSNNYLIAMWRFLLGGYEFPQELTKDRYIIWRTIFNKMGFEGYGDTFDEAMIGWYGFMGSFNGRFFDGGYSGHDVKGRNYISEQINNTLKQIESLKGVELYCANYSSFEIQSNSVIYCDPPYANTKQYSTSKSFNQKEFWQWCRYKTKQGNDVLISEYAAPQDFVLVWEMEVTNSMNQTNTHKPIEKLFVHESIADKYIEKTLFD